MARFELLDEPRGAQWRLLLHCALSQCAFIQFTVRDSISLSAVGYAFLDRLRNSLSETVRAKEWPGTTLLEGAASLYRYRVDASSSEIVAHATDHLFGFQQPELPEDICLLRQDGSVWMLSITHEEYAELMISEVDQRILKSCAELSWLRLAAIQEDT